MSAEICLDSIRKDLKACYPYPELIDALPEEVFFQAKYLSAPRPLFRDCTDTLTLAPNLMIMKIRHKKSNQVIGVYLDKQGCSFSLSKDTNQKYFSRLTDFFNKDLQIAFLIEILKEENNFYELALD